MSSNLFRPLLHTSLCFLLAYFCLFGHFACVHIMHVPPSATGEVVEFEKIIFQHPHPISRSLDSNLHEFEFISTSMAHFFMLFVGLFLTFVASLHVCTLCMFPQKLQVRLLSSRKLFSYTHTLFRGRSTRICMSSNLFRPLSHTF